MKSFISIPGIENHCIHCYGIFSNGTGFSFVNTANFSQFSSDFNKFPPSYIRISCSAKIGGTKRDEVWKRFLSWKTKSTGVNDYKKPVHVVSTVHL